MSATLAGNVTLGAGGVKNLVIRFFTPNTDTEVMKACSPTDASGNFTIYGITPDTYDVGIKCDSSLSLLAEDQVFTGGSTTNINFGILLHGDLNGSDKVDAIDNALLSGNYNKSGACKGYAGNWLMPACPSPPPAGGACYGYVIS
jgi:hypothetical protein